MATSGDFGTVATNDDPSITEWQWEESSNDADWANVGTILTDISGQTTTTLTVNSATEGMDGTYVRCKGTHAGGDIFSHSALLTVSAGSISPEAQAVLDRMTAISVPEQDAIIAFVDSQVASGNWAKLDEFWCYALNGTDWLTGWKSLTATAFRNLTRTANGAYQGDTDAEYSQGVAQTGLIPANQSVMQDGSLSMGIYLHSHSCTSGWHIGGVEDANGAFWRTLEIRHDGSNVIVNASDQSVSNALALGSFAGKLHTVNNVSGTTSYWQDGVQVGNTGSDAGQRPSVYQMYLCSFNERDAINQWPGQHTITSAYFGNGTIDHLDLYTNLMTLHTALGVS